MTTVEIKLDDGALARVERAAREKGLPIGDFIAKLITEEAAALERGDVFIGMLADEPELADAIAEDAMRARERDPLRG